MKSRYHNVEIPGVHYQIGHGYLKAEADSRTGQEEDQHRRPFKSLYRRLFGGPRPDRTVLQVWRMMSGGFVVARIVYDGPSGELRAVEHAIVYEERDVSRGGPLEETEPRTDEEIYAEIRDFFGDSPLARRIIAEVETPRPALRSS